MEGAVVLVRAPIDLDSTIKAPVPLAPLYLGAVLRDAGFSVSLFDLHHERTDWKDVESAVSRRRPCLVGFSAMTSNIHRVLHLSDRLLDRFPHVTVVLGGPHVTHIWEPYVSERRLVIRDEGEYALLRFAKHVLRGEGDLDSVPSLAYVVHGEVRANPMSLGPYEEIDAIPFPDYSLLPDKEFYVPAVITSRGCPHRCYFCPEHVRHRPYRARSVGNVEAELHALKGQYRDRIPYLAFCDDNFTSTASRVHEMCDMIDRVFPDKSHFGFFCEARADVLADSPELVVRLKQAGMLGIQIGIESGNQALLDQMNKGIRREQIEEVLAWCEKAGVPHVVGNFIFGLPHQTREDIDRDIAFAKHLGDLAPARVELSVAALVPYPGTEYRVNAAKWGLTIVDDEFVTGRLGRSSFVETEHLSREDIERGQQRFMNEVGDYLLEQAAPHLTPRVCKDQVVMAAETSQRTYVLSRFCCFAHIARLVLLRRRTDYRFLFEVPDDNVRDCAPVAVPDNAVARCGTGYKINAGSPLEFTLSDEEMKYYRCFVGKLTFAEIAGRLAGKEKIPLKEAYERCLAVYRECEDSLAAIALV